MSCWDGYFIWQEVCFGFWMPSLWRPFTFLYLKSTSWRQDFKNLFIYSFAQIYKLSMGDKIITITSENKRKKYNANMPKPLWLFTFSLVTLVYIVLTKYKHNTHSVKGQILVDIFTYQLDILPWIFQKV